MPPSVSFSEPVGTSINELAVAENLISKYPNTIVFGDFARGLKSNYFTPVDKAILITSDTNMVVDACVKLRTRVGLFKTTLKAKSDNAIKSYIICASVDEDPEEEDSEEFKGGFLSPDEWKELKSVPHVKNTIRYGSVPCVPDLAKVVWSVACSDINQFTSEIVIHVVNESVSIEKYAEALVKQLPATEIACDSLYMLNGKFTQLHPKSFEDIDNKIIRYLGDINTPKSMIVSYKVVGLKKAGWKYHA